MNVLHLAGRPAGSVGRAMAPELAGWRQLAAAVLLRACEDARCTNGDRAALEAGIPPGVSLAYDARAFLWSDGAAWLAAMLDLPAGALERIRAELPELEAVQLPLWRWPA